MATFKDKFRTKIEVTNKDGSRTHLTTGERTAAATSTAPNGAPPSSHAPPRKMARPKPKPKTPPPPEEKPKRKVEYKPYTVSDYKKINVPVDLGKLGYQETEETRKAREQRSKMREYSSAVKMVNGTLPTLPPPTTGGQAKIEAPADPDREAARERREKAMQFAKKVPKPKVVKKKGERGPGGDVDDLATNEGANFTSELELLEMQHQCDRDAVAAMKRELRM